MKDFIFHKKLGVFRNEAGEIQRESIAERTIKVIHKSMMDDSKDTTKIDVEKSDIFTPLFVLAPDDPEIATVYPVEIIYSEEEFSVSDQEHMKTYSKAEYEIVREYFYPDNITPTGCFPCRRCGKCG